MSNAATPRVLVTYDGSPASLAALAPAARLARLMAGELILLQVHHPSLKLAVIVDPDERERELRAVEAEMERALTEIVKGLEGKVKAFVRRLGERWNVVEEILYWADEYEVELICMATHGASAIRHFIAGSTALEVLSKSKRPVALIPSP